MMLSVARNPDLLTQRKEQGHQALGLHKKNVERGLQHRCLAAQTADPEVVQPSKQCTGGAR